MTPRTIEAVLSLEIDARTQALLERKEDQWFDRKSIKTSPKKLAETLVALANAEGGKVAVGISEGKIQPTEEYPELENKLRRTLTADFLEMPFPANVFDVEVRLANGSTGHILMFDVSPADHLARTADGSVFLRDGDSTDEQKPAQIRELEYSRGVAVFEAEPVDMKLTELNSAYIEEFARAVDSTRDHRHLLLSRSLITREGRVTNAACLLFSEDPTICVPGSEIRVVRYLGKERLTGERQNIVFDKRTALPIPRAIDQALVWVNEQIPKRKALVDDTKFGEVPLAPRPAWTEGIVNAAVHRSYSFIGDHIRVEIFDDRIEITNPGDFRYVTGRIVNPLAIVRYARNPRIARTCTDLGYTQELGEGIKRIFDEMQRAGLEEPVYEQAAMHVKLTLPFIAKVSGLPAEKMPKHGDRVLVAMRRLNGHGGTSEIAAAANLSRPTARATLQILQELGLIAWVGKSPTDPRAEWKILLK